MLHQYTRITADQNGIDGFNGHHHTFIHIVGRVLNDTVCDVGGLFFCVQCDAASGCLPILVTNNAIQNCDIFALKTFMNTVMSNRCFNSGRIAAILIDGHNTPRVNMVKDALRSVFD